MKRKLPRWAKILRNTLLILILGCSLWIVTEQAILFPKLHLRWEEYLHQIGPSTVVDHLDEEEYDEFEHLLVGETDHGVVFYSIYWDRITDFSYREKTGDLTVLAAPTWGEDWSRSYKGKRLPIYLFDEYPLAVRAEMEITVSSNPENIYYSGVDFSRSWSLKADRESDGHFLFWLEVPEKASQLNALGTDGEAAQLLSRICHSDSWEYAVETADITVRLYNAAGDMIKEQALTLRSVIGAAHIR